MEEVWGLGNVRDSDEIWSTKLGVGVVDDDAQSIGVQYMKQAITVILSLAQQMSSPASYSLPLLFIALIMVPTLWLVTLLYFPLINFVTLM